MKLCADCQRGKAKARGLCARCYSRRERTGTLPPRTRFYPAGTIRTRQKSAEHLEYNGRIERVRLRLTPEDVYGQRGSSADDTELLGLR